MSEPANNTPAPATTTAPAPAADISTPSPSGASAPATSWLESLPDDIKKDPSLQLFKEPAALAKSWVEAQKMIGADKVIIPGEKASEEEVARFYQKLGRPESADKYEIKLAEGKKMDETLAKGLKDVAFKAGLTGKQVQALVDWNESAMADAQKASQAAQSASIKQAQEEYAQKIGGQDKFKLQVEKAMRAVTAVVPDDLKKHMRDTGIGSRPEFIEFFAKLADMMAEDKIRDGTNVPFSDNSREAIQREIADIEEKMFKDLDNSSRPDWVAQRSKLYERLSELNSAQQ